MEFGFGPPKFHKDNFNLWKCRMSLFLESTDYNIPAIIKNGPYVPVNPESQWSDEDKKLVHLDVKIRLVIVTSLPENVQLSVMCYRTAKDMWDNLCVIYEGTEKVKKMKKVNLNRQYELFFAKKGETVTDTFNRFNRLLNDLSVVGTEKEDIDLVNKFMDALPDHWDNLITCLRMNDSLNKMSLAGLYGTFLYHEQLKAESKNAMKESVSPSTKQVTRVGKHEKLKEQTNQGRGKDRVSKTYDWANDSETSSFSDEEDEIVNVCLMKYELSYC